MPVMEKARAGWAGRAAVWCVKLVSAFFRAMGMRACRFEPSCSRYSAEAFMSLGFFEAAAVSAGRLLRCHPLSRGGFDPLPADKKAATRRSD